MNIIKYKCDENHHMSEIENNFLMKKWIVGTQRIEASNIKLYFKKNDFFSII